MIGTALSCLRPKYAWIHSFTSIREMDKKCASEANSGAHFLFWIFFIL